MMTHTYRSSDTNSFITDVDSPAWLLLTIDEVFYPVDVVEAQGHGGYEAFQRDLDGQTKVFLQQGAGQCSHRLWLFEIHTKRKNRSSTNVTNSIKAAAPLQSETEGNFSISFLLQIRLDNINLSDSLTSISDFANFQLSQHLI